MPMFGDYAKYYDVINRDKPYKKECKFIYKWADKPKSILDIGCGTANYWQYFPIRPIGIEKSKEMIAQSKYQKCIIQADILNMSSISTMPCNRAEMPFSDTNSQKTTPTTFDCVIALFDVMNYLPSHDWWKSLPLKKGGYFIFDIWDSNKVKKDGFSDSTKIVNGIEREIYPWKQSKKAVFLIIFGQKDRPLFSPEIHLMFIYSAKDIQKFCGKEFHIEHVIPTKTWQTWYKLRRY
jgi:SAM-dependent methyltransferase